MYVVHPRCTWDTQVVRGTFKLILRHFKEYITLKNVRGKLKMYVGHLGCTWDIQTNIQALKAVDLTLKCTWDGRVTPKLYMGHPICTWDITTNIEALKMNVGHPRCTWDTQDVRGTSKYVRGTLKLILKN